MPMSMRGAVVWCVLVGLAGCGVEEEQAPELAKVQPLEKGAAECGGQPGGAECDEVVEAEKPSALVGQPLDTNAIRGVKQWYVPARGEGELDLVVFFEVWCPHCRNEMPHLTELDAMPGVEVTALTRQSRGVTDEQVRAFVEQHKLPFGVAQVDEQLSEELGIRGIPRAVVVKDGAIVWDGHPGKLTAEVLKGWL